MNDYKIRGNKVDVYLTRDKVTVIDKTNLELISKYKWHTLKDGNTYYARTTYKGTSISMHRLITGCPKDKIVDHIDKNGLNNLNSNLRITTYSINLQRKNCKIGRTGYRGVRYLDDQFRTNPYQAKINVNGIFIHGGCYKTAKEAALAYNELALKYFDKHAKMNKV